MLEDHIYLDPSLLVPTGDPPPQPPAPDTNEVRRIYFIHGLGNNKSAFSMAATACEVGATNFPARKCEVILPDYSLSLDTLYLAANDVRNKIGNQADIDRERGKYNLIAPKPNLLNPARAIIIAHSQGGIVTRELMHLDMVQPGSSGTGHSTLWDGMNYGGVVTVASPLQGAMILNNRQSILNMANDACNRIASATIEGEIPDIVLPFLRNKLNSLIDGACKFASNTALPEFFFNDHYKKITKSYSVGANDINILNQDTNNAQYMAFPKMAFYAVEPQTNIFWRTLNWMVKNPNDTSSFQANDDWDLLDSAQKIINNFQARKESYYAEYQRCNGIYMNTRKIPFPLINLGIGYIYITKAHAAYSKYLSYRDGLEWFDNVNESWKDVIGVRTTFVMGERHHVVKYTDCDGVVLAESAANLPGATWEPVKIFPNENSSVDINKGSSHMQVRNDEGLREHLDKLFTGNYHPWFKVEKQQ